MNISFAVPRGFTARTFDDLVKPLLIYQLAYDKVNEEYSLLLADTDIWADVANRELNPESYGMYKKYSNDLEYVTDDFSKGMTLSNRKALMKMKRRYNKEIVPIKKASEAMKEYTNYRDTVLAKDSSAFFQVENFKLDDFLNGKTVSKNYESGDKILARTAARAEAIGKAMFSDPVFVKSIMDNQYYQYMTANGATPALLFAAIAHDPSASPYLTLIYDDMWKTFNGDSYSAEGQAKMREAITTGMYAALAKPTYETVKNPNVMDAYQKANIGLDWARFNFTKERAAIDDERYNRESGITPYNIYQGKATGEELNTAAGEPVIVGEFSNGAMMWKSWKDTKGKWHPYEDSYKLLSKSSSEGTSETSLADAAKDQKVAVPNK